MDQSEFLDELAALDEQGAIVDFCRKKILHGTPFVFQGNEDGYYRFRKLISNKFGVNFFDVHIVGSARLGFSPRKKTYFDYNSDIDVAIVSESLFNEIMGKISDFQYDLRKNRETITEREIKKYHNFLEYVAIGWIRPDLLPVRLSIGDLKTRWFSFFKSISNGNSEVGDYKVAAGVYKTYFCLEKYVVDGIRDVQQREKVGE